MNWFKKGENPVGERESKGLEISRYFRLLAWGARFIAITLRGTPEPFAGPAFTVTKSGIWQGDPLL